MRGAALAACFHGEPRCTAVLDKALAKTHFSRLKRKNVVSQEAPCALTFVLLSVFNMPSVSYKTAATAASTQTTARLGVVSYFRLSYFPGA